MSAGLNSLDVVNHYFDAAARALTVAEATRLRGISNRRLA
jgi:hypothetical protein